MSRATEIAEREAAAAEAENPDAEPVEPIEPDENEEAEAEEGAEPPAEPSSLAVIQSMEKALEAEAKRHEKAVAKALGEHWADFTECPLCQVSGYTMAYGPGEISPEQRDSIMVVMGEGGAAAIPHDPRWKRCTDCNGHGKRESGSLMEAYYYELCDTCQNTGRVPTGSAPSERPALASVPQYPWDEPAAPVVAPNVDRWGRNMGHPDFGLDPNTIVSVAQ